MTRGFRFCPVPIRREDEAQARAVLSRHAAVVPGSVRFDGWRINYQLDLAVLPAGDGPAVEEVIRREIEREVR